MGYFLMFFYFYARKLYKSLDIIASNLHIDCIKKMERSSSNIISHLPAHVKEKNSNVLANGGCSED